MLLKKHFLLLKCAIFFFGLGPITYCCSFVSDTFLCDISPVLFLFELLLLRYYIMLSQFIRKQVILTCNLDLSLVMHHRNFKILLVLNFYRSYLAALTEQN